MSRSSHIEITIFQKNYSVYNTLMILLENGWSLESDGRIQMLPLGDKEEYNWTDFDLTEKENALEIIKRKIAANEVVGVILTWANSDVGVIVLFKHNNTILFSLLINRKPLENSKFTDVSWYLTRIIPPLTSAGLEIENILWNEHV